MNNEIQTSAADLCSIGIDQYGRFRADAMQYINASIAADDNYCLPKIVKAFMLHGAGDATFSNQVAELIEQTQLLAPTESSREHKLLSALRLAHEGRGVEASSVFEQVLNESPTDLFTHVLLHEKAFWLGQPHWMHDVVERAAPAWKTTHKNYGPFVALRAFANEEAGHFVAAEKFGREAVEIDPSDVWGAHAVAHVHVMQGEMHRGVNWLESLCGNWGHANQMRHHLWWHLCLFLLELGEFDRVVNLLDSEVRNPTSVLVQQSPTATIDIGNYASLLMRLELYGVDVATQWQTLATICAERVFNHGSAFSNTHDMMVLTATGQTEKAKSLLDSMKQNFASNEQVGSSALAYRVVGIPVCEALLAHRAKDYAEVLRTLGAVRHQLQLMGASHAQRDVFYHLLVHAAEQEQRDDLRQVFLHDIERLGFCDVPNRAAYKKQ